MTPEQETGGERRKIAELLPDGLFVLRTDDAVSLASFRVGATTVTARMEKPALPSGEPVTSKDSWPSGVNDPFHPDNLVARCFDLWMSDGPPFRGPVPSSFDGPAGWQPTLLIGKTDEVGLPVVHQGSDTAYRTLLPGPLRVAAGVLPFTLWPFTGTPRREVTILAGTVDQEKVSRREFTGPGGRRAEAEIALGTYAARWTGDPILADHPPSVFTVKVVGKHGDVLYDGPAA